MKRINCVYALITDDAKRRVLMVHNKDTDGWTLPGGTVEGQETLTEAVVREAKEETGYDIRVHGIVAVNEVKLQTAREHVLFMTFRAEIVGGEASITRPEEIVAVEWIGLERADKLMPYYREGLSGLVARNREVTYFDEGSA